MALTGIARGAVGERVSLEDLRQIAIVIGAPPPRIPSSYDWVGAGVA